MTKYLFTWGMSSDAFLIESDAPSAVMEVVARKWIEAYEDGGATFDVLDMISEKGYVYKSMAF